MSEANQVIQGSMVALVTPMLAENHEIDWQALSQLVDWHIEQETDAIIAVGTTGESSTLSHKEHIEIVEKIVQQVNGRMPIIAGTGSNSTREAIDLTQAARKAGADAALLMVPYYNKPPQQGLIRHFLTLADAVDIPQILYNVPSRTITDILPETLAEISYHPNIIGIKEATGDIGRVEKIHRLCGEGFHIYSGDDASCVELMLAGGKGCISVTANVVPALMHQLCELAIAGKASEARQLNETLSALHSVLFVESNPIPVKYALHLCGRIQNAIRLPLVPLLSSHHPQIEAVLRDLSLLH